MAARLSLRSPWANSGRPIQTDGADAAAGGDVHHLGDPPLVFRPPAVGARDHPLARIGEHVLAVVAAEHHHHDVGPLFLDAGGQLHPPVEHVGPSQPGGHLDIARHGHPRVVPHEALNSTAMLPMSESPAIRIRSGWAAVGMRRAGMVVVVEATVVAVDTWASRNLGGRHGARRRQRHVGSLGSSRMGGGVGQPQAGQVEAQGVAEPGEGPGDRHRDVAARPEGLALRHPDHRVRARQRGHAAAP